MTKMRFIFITLVFFCTSLLNAMTVASKYSNNYTAHDMGEIPGLPHNYGGLTFVKGDNNKILIGGNANTANGKFYEITLTRDSNGHITGFSTPVAKGFGAYNDAGIAYGPSDVLLYSKYKINKMGQVKLGANSESKEIDFGASGIDVSPGAIVFVPAGNLGQGRLKIISYGSGKFYDVVLSADGRGTFNIQSATLKRTIAGGPEGAIYAPPDAPIMGSNKLLVTKYGANKVVVYDIDSNGDPILNTEEDFITGLDHGVGAAIDPVSGDFLFSTFGSVNHFIRVEGFTPPPPPANISLVSDNSQIEVGNSVTFTATVTKDSSSSHSTTGTVKFQADNSDIVGCEDVSLVGNQAVCSTSSLSIGNIVATAFYSGDTYNGPASNSINQEIIKPINNLPVATPNSYTIPEDGVLDIVAPGVLANDTDADGNTLFALISTQPSNGTLTFSSDGAFTYTPNSNYNGTDSFTYTVNDGIANGNTTTVTINVNSQNDQPIAHEDNYQILEDGVLKVTLKKGLLANDTDIDGDVLSVLASSVSTPSHGKLVVNSDGTFIYVVDENYNGTDSFTYQATDSNLNSSDTKVNITIRSTNDMPTSTNDSYTISQGSVLNVNSTNGLLKNDLDVDGDSLWVKLQTTPINGSLQMSLDGSFSYTPNATFSGIDSFTYSANDGSVDGNIVTVTINVNAVNTAPLSASDSYTISQGSVLNVNSTNGLLKNDLDVDGDNLIALLYTYPSNGALHINLDGSFSYIPANGFTGTDSFTYKANDGKESSNLSVVTINVLSVNSAPLGAADSYNMAKNTVLNIQSAGVLDNDIDVDGNQLFVKNVTVHPTNGILDIKPDGTFSYAATSGYVGLDSFKYIISDGHLDSTEINVVIDVRDTNSSPVASNDSYSIAAGRVLTVDSLGVMANDNDLDGDNLKAIIVNSTANGTLVLNQDGSFTYNSPLSVSTDQFTYKVYDGKEFSNEATVTITITDAVDTHAIVNTDGSTTTATFLTPTSTTTTSTNGDIKTQSTVLTTTGQNVLVSVVSSTDGKSVFELTTSDNKTTSVSNTIPGSQTIVGKDGNVSSVYERVENDCIVLATSVTSNIGETLSAFIRACNNGNSDIQMTVDPTTPFEPGNRVRIFEDASQLFIEVNAIVSHELIF